jgi:hypothetical protein
MRRRVFQIMIILAGVGLAAAAAKRLLHHTPQAHVRLLASASVDVSSAPGPQSEVAMAADPTRPSVIIAGSNDIDSKTMRAYDSSDGGHTWRSGHLPLPGSNGICAASDPGVAIAPDGTQYFTFLGIRCTDGRPRSSSIYVATRSSITRAWHTLPLAVSTGSGTTLIDDRPSISIDGNSHSLHRGRLYVGWTRFSFDVSSIWADPDQQDVHYVDVEALVSHSDDAGRHWSKPVVLSQQGSPLEVRLAEASDGEVYAVWRDAKTNGIYISRSADGSSFTAGRLVAASVVRADHSCQTARARIPAQPRRCVSPNPTIAADTSAGPGAGQVYVVWGSTSLNQSQDVFVASFARDLHPLLGVGRVQQVNPAEGIRGSDQFLPTATIDPKSGRLWVCYYQSKGAAAHRARFTCTASDNGGKSWLTPVPATTVFSDESRRPANVANGYGDYEAAVVASDRLIATWTDGRALRSQREEIFAASITSRTSKAGS